MARYVVLSFEDNDEAEAFIDGLQSGEEFAFDSATLKDQAQVLALIAQPTQFHDTTCPGSGRRVRPFSRGKKYGWWVCVACSKPSPPQGEDHRAKAENLMRQTVSQGVNLIKDAANQYASVFDRGWGAMGRGPQ